MFTTQESGRGALNDDEEECLVTKPQLKQSPDG